MNRALHVFYLTLAGPALVLVYFLVQNGFAERNSIFLVDMGDGSVASTLNLVFPGHSIFDITMCRQLSPSPLFTAATARFICLHRFVRKKYTGYKQKLMIVKTNKELERKIIFGPFTPYACLCNNIQPIYTLNLSACSCLNNWLFYPLNLSQS